MSSYARMDHADWVQRQIDAEHSRTRPAAADKRAAAQGKGWLAAPARLTDFHVRLSDILGIAGGGIYNAPIQWDSLSWKWGGSDSLSLLWRGDLATFDHNDLTKLVVLCHRSCIRFDIEAASRGYLRLSFWQRHTRTGGIGRRHPDIYEAADNILEDIGPNHRINSRGAHNDCAHEDAA